MKITTPGAFTKASHSLVSKKRLCIDHTETDSSYTIQPKMLYSAKELKKLWMMLLLRWYYVVCNSRNTDDMKIYQPVK